MEHDRATPGLEQGPLTEWESEFRDRMHKDGITDPERQREVIEAIEKAILDRATKEGLIPSPLDNKGGNDL